MSCWKWWIHDRSVGWFHLFTGLTGPTYRDEILQILPYHSLLSTSNVHGTLDANPCSYNQLQLGWWILVYLWWNTTMISRSVGRVWTTKSACKSFRRIPPKWPEGHRSSSFSEGQPPFWWHLCRRGLQRRCHGAARCPRGWGRPSGASGVESGALVVSTGFLDDRNPGSPTTNYALFFFSVGLQVSPFLKEGFFSSSNPGTAMFFLQWWQRLPGEKFAYPHGSLSVATVLFSVRRGVALGRHRDGFPIKACSFLWFVF